MKNLSSQIPSFVGVNCNDASLKLFFNHKFKIFEYSDNLRFLFHKIKLKVFSIIIHKHNILVKMTKGINGSRTPNITV